MYDKLLAKDEFFAKLKAAGYSQEETETNWINLGKLFEASLFKNAYAKLPKEKVREIIGKDDMTLEEAPEAISKLGVYLREHNSEFDYNSMIVESAKQAIDLMRAHLSS